MSNETGTDNYHPAELLGQDVEIGREQSSERDKHYSELNKELGRISRALTTIGPMCAEAHQLGVELSKQSFDDIAEGEPKPYEELKVEIDNALADLDKMDPQEAFGVGVSLLREIEKLYSNLVEEGKKIESEFSSSDSEWVDNALLRLKQELRDIRALPKMIRFFYSRAEQNKIIQQANLEQEKERIKQAKNREVTLRDQLGVCSVWLQQIKSKVDNKINGEEQSYFDDGVESAVDRYEAVVREMVNDNEINREIKHNYIDQTLRPLLVVGRKSDFSAEMKEELLNSLHQAVNGTKSEQDAVWKRFQNYCTGSSIVSPFSNEHVLVFIESMMALVAANDILDTTLEAGRRVSGTNAHQKNPYLIDRYQMDIVGKSRSSHSYLAKRQQKYQERHPLVVDQKDKNFRSTTANYVDQLGILHPDPVTGMVSAAEFKYPNMNFWTAVTNSESVKKVLGAKLESAGKAVCEVALGGSLGDSEGNHIDVLTFFPQPEVVRQLIVLATTQNFGYRTVHANWALCTLQKRPDWKQILDETERVYPELSEIRHVLEDWRDSDYCRNTELVGVSADLNISVMKSKDNNVRLRELSLDALPLGPKLKFLVDEGLMLETDQAKIWEGYQSIQEKSQVAEQEGKYSFIDFESFDNYYNNYINQFIKNYFINKKDFDKNSQPFSRLVIIAEKVVEEKDREALSYLSRVVKEDLFMSDDLAEDRLNMILTAYEKCPFLSTSARLREAVCRKLQKMEGGLLDNFAEVAKIFGDDSKEFENFVELAVGKTNDLVVSLDRVVQLAKIAPDIFGGEFFACAVRNQARFLATDEGVEDFRKLKECLNGQDMMAINNFADLIVQNGLSVPLFVEVYSKRKSGFAHNVLYDKWVQRFPKLFLQHEASWDLLGVVEVGSDLGSISNELEAKAGNMLVKTGPERQSRFDSLTHKLLVYEVGVATKQDFIKIDDSNWLSLLTAYVSLDVDGLNIMPLSNDPENKLRELFKQTETKDFCLNKLQSLWAEYLQGDQQDNIPFNLQLVARFVEYCGGAGPLSQIEALSAYISSYSKAFAILPDMGKEAKKKGTKDKIFAGAGMMEARFEKERWSNEDRTFFYAISADILSAASSLYSAFLPGLKKMSPAQLKYFGEAVFPICRTYLIFLEKIKQMGAYVDEDAPKEYELEALVSFRTEIKGLANPGRDNTKLDQFKDKLSKEIIEMFKNRFGIIKLPENMTADHLRSVSNISKYLGNLHDRRPLKENLIGFYLALMINEKWEAFRQGEEINPAEYLAPDKARAVAEVLEQRKAANFLTAEKLGVSTTDFPKVMKILQQESSSLVIGEVETVDVKVGNLIRNLQAMEDLDLYPDPLEKAMMGLLLQYGNEKIGKAVTNLYLVLSGKPRTISKKGEVETVDDLKNEGQIQEQIRKILQDNQLEATPQTIKQHFQDELRPLATVANLGQFVRRSGAEEMVDELKVFLVPSAEVVAIFTRLGEEFTPVSGAMAMTQDLNFLSNIIVKREDELKPGEKELLMNYLEKIQEKVIALQEVYEQVKIKFDSLKKSNVKSSNTLLQQKMADIDQILNAQDKQKSITSVMTNDLNLIIENMRECLACVRSGCNNDTNLTFGESNKFYIMSKTEEQKKGSIADQIVFFEPVVYAGGQNGLSFVVDRLYGNHSETILLNNIDTIMKKYRSMRELLPQANLSICITDSAITSALSSESLLRQKLQDKYGSRLVIVSEVVGVDVKASALGDHYVEFGGGSRTPGHRAVGSLVIRG